MRKAILFVSALSLFSIAGIAQQKKRLDLTKPINLPYNPISGAFTGKEVKESPDPLVAYRWEDPKASYNLEVYELKPISLTSSQEGAATWKKKDLTTITVSEPTSLMFDFGQVNPGWLEFDCPNLQGATIRMSISEFTEPGVFNRGPLSPAKTGKPVRIGNTYRLQLNSELFEGVRYTWIHVDSIAEPIEITNVRLVCQIRPSNYDGSFSCSDPYLTRIWYTGAYAVRTNLFKDYFGAILIDRGDRHSWTGDAHPSQAASMVAFGNFDFVRHNLLYTSKQFNGIASYSLYWVLSLLDYYHYTNDRETLETLLDNACKKLDVAYAHYGKNPKLRFLGWDERLGAGFENANCLEGQNTYKMTSIRAWNEFAKAMKTYGRNDLAEKYGNYAQEKITELRQDPEWHESFQLFSATDAILTGLASEQECQDMWNQAFTERLHRISYTPFNQHFIMQAMSQMNCYDQALTTIDDCWGGQLRYGGTTFFEVFRPSWVSTMLAPNDAPVNNQCGYTSLTHPWSSGIVKWLSNEVLGIQPTQPGFKTFQVKPHLGSTLTSVEGTMPTPHGIIGFELDTKKGKAHLKVPQNTTARLAIPKMGRSITQVKINKEKTAFTSEDDEYLYYDQLAASDYEINIKYKGASTLQAVEEPFAYKYNNIASIDSTTQGNWSKMYGTSGYVLFNHEKKDTHVSKTPNYLKNIQYKKTYNRTIAFNTNDVRALQNPDQTNRSLGIIHTGDPLACQQTFTIDLTHQHKDTPYQVAIYFVDWERNGRRSAIEIFDLDNKKLLAPITMVRNYQEGKYVVLKLDQSVRIRINQVRGTNVSIGGIFFD